MKTYYFTYGCDNNMPFVGGWTEVVAPDLDKAVEVFCKFHGRTDHGFVNCSFIYDEDSFKKTKMYSNGNFGYKCHEELKYEEVS